MLIFRPEQVFIEKDAMDYAKGKELYHTFQQKNIPTEILKSNRMTGLRIKNKKEKYLVGKRTLVVGIRRSLTFQTCKPSAHYQLPLVTGCMGQCEYCYLNTRFGDQPYIRVYINTEDILKKAKKYIEERGEETIFEGSAASDPVPVESYTKALAKSIQFFANEEKGKFRFVTKYTDIDELLSLDHRGHTTIRFSLNTDQIIKEYEHKTPSLKKRLEASKKVYDTGYPMGFLIAPVLLYPNWKEEYKSLIENIQELFKGNKRPISFEIISHRFTASAKKIIQEIYENTTLPMDEEERKYKYGQFGYGKYIYPNEEMEDIKSFFQNQLKDGVLVNTINYMI